METKLDALCEKLSLNEFEKVKPIKNLAEKVKVKPAYLILGLISILFLSIVAEYGSSIISSVIGFLYPAYMSFKAIESKASDDDTQWLTYWVVFSFFTVFDPLLNAVLFFIPFYYLFKVLIYIWLFHPYTMGAKTIYEKFLRALFLKHESLIDGHVKNIQQKGAETLNQAGSAAKDLLNKNQANIINAAIDLKK